MFPSPLLGSYSRFPSPCSTWKRFYKFPNPMLGISSMGFPFQHWVKVVYVLKSNTGKVPLSSTGKRLYRFTSPIQGKGSRFPSPILGKGCRFPSPVLVKGSRFPSPILGKGSIGSTVQHWKKVL